MVPTLKRIGMSIAFRIADTSKAQVLCSVTMKVWWVEVVGGAATWELLGF